MKKGDKFGNGYIKSIDKQTGNITVTVSPTPLLPDWKEIAYELADIIDNLNLVFMMRDKKGYQESPEEELLIKNFRKAQSHFIRYKHDIMYIDDYKKRKEQDDKMMMNMMNAFKEKT